MPELRPEVELDADQGEAAVIVPRGSVTAAAPGRAAAQVTEFHRVYGLPVRAAATAEVGPEQAALRQALIEEEVSELRQAVDTADIVAIADALADIVYVAYGSALTYGIDLDAVIDEVHRSNMTKLDEYGQPIRRFDGKILKGPGYQPPNVAKILAETGVKSADC